VDKLAVTKPRFQLSSEELRRYKETGYLIREKVFTITEVLALQVAAERAVENALRMCEKGTTYILDGKRFVDVDYLTVQFEPGVGNDNVRVIEPVNELDSELDQLVADPRLTEPMKSLVGAEKIALWTAKLNLKRPHEGSGFGWHQDSPYWIHDCNHVDQLPNVMIAFDDANEKNGCFKVISGSHTEGCLPGKDDGTQLGGFYTNTDNFDETDQVAMEVPAGSLIFFDPHTVHGSSSNSSSHPRRVIIITYQPAGFPQLKSGQIRNIEIHG
jgi:hypothetical protein